jgi:hypothetical protein
MVVAGMTYTIDTTAVVDTVLQMAPHAGELDALSAVAGWIILAVVTVGLVAIYLATR